MEDLYDLLNSNETPFADAPKSGGSSSETKEQKKARRESLFDAKEIKPEKITVDKFDTTGKYFSFMWYVEAAFLPDDETVAKFAKIAKYLFSKGFTYRAIYDSRNTLNNKIAELDGAKIEYYTPWKFKGIDESLPVKRYNPSSLAYGIACNNHRIFMKLANGLRARLAAEVHSILGDDCLHPLSFIVSYSASGDEGLTKNIDFKAIKTMTFAYRIAGESNIPIYNIKNEGALERIMNKVKIITGEQ